MTTEALVKIFNTEFGMSAWPESYEVDYETYANVCVSVIKERTRYAINGRIVISIGPNEGIMLKNVELILK